jgi:hypothetical protein
MSTKAIRRAREERGDLRTMVTRVTLHALAEYVSPRKFKAAGGGI